MFQASLEKPANIPVVLAFPCVLYQTRIGGYHEEVSLPLGMVVNAVFKNQMWLYVQTPHGEEGYVSYVACLPLGILPPPQRASKPAPCWETHTDIFPQPLGNRTDSEKIRDGTRSECGGRGRCYSHLGRRGRYDGERDAVSACGERSVDRLYLRAAASAKCKGTTRHTLLVIRSDYNSKGRNTLSVTKGDVVALVSGHLKDWFWVRSRDGNEGFIPSVVAGHGFLWQPITGSYEQCAVFYIPYEKNALIHSANMKEHRDPNCVTLAAIVSEDYNSEYTLLGVTFAIGNYITWYVERMKESKKEERKRINKLQLKDCDVYNSSANLHILQTDPSIMKWVPFSKLVIYSWIF